jgi:hypothetical protein
MALDDILIRIRAAFEGKGAAEASTALESLDQSSRRAAPALDKTSDAAGKAGKAARVSAEEFTRAARSASVLSGSMDGLGAMVSQIAQRFTGLAAALPAIGLLVAAFTAWKAAISGVVEMQKQAAKNLRDITATNSENAVRSMAKAFDDLQKSIANAADEQKRFVDGQQAMADAQKTLTLANIDAAEQAALSKESDPLRQSVIKARFTEQRTGVTSSADTESEMRKADMLDRQRVLAELSQQSAAEQVSSLQGEYGRAAAQSGMLKTRQQSAMDSAWTPLGVEKAGAAWQPERDRNLKELQDLAEQIKSARDIAEKARIEADTTRTLLEAQLVRVQASRVSGSTAFTAAGAASTTAATAVTAADLAAQRTAAEAQLGPLAAQASTAHRALSDDIPNSPSMRLAKRPIKVARGVPAAFPLKSSSCMPFLPAVESRLISSVMPGCKSRSAASALRASRIQSSPRS